MDKAKESAKEAPKGNTRTETSQSRCWDWIIVSGTSHYARDRSSFVTYRRVGRTVSSGLIGGNIFVAGIGTVELKVRPSKTENLPTRTLVLDNVLHVPSAICNGFCFAKYQRAHGGSVSFGIDMYGTDRQKHPLWYGVPFCELEKLALAGNPQGESYLEDITRSDISPSLSMYIDNKDLEAMQS